MGNTFTALGYLAVAAAFLGNLAVPILSLATRNDPATVGTAILGVLAAILTVIISMRQQYSFTKQPQPAQIASATVDSPAPAIAVANLHSEDQRSLDRWAKMIQEETDRHRGLKLAEELGVCGQAQTDVGVFELFSVECTCILLSLVSLYSSMCHGRCPKNRSRGRQI
jgi:hypothetical protein